MMNLDYLQKVYFQNGIDVPYELKRGGIINIKPILVKDYSMYELGAQLLQYDKNTINDINIIQMSYLDYLVEVVFKQEPLFIQNFIVLCELCFGYSAINFEKEKNKNHLLLLKEIDNNGKKEYIKDKIISPKEFDEISKIILNQNDVNYDDRYLSPEVREEIEAFYKLKYKNVDTPTLEVRKAYVMSKSGYNLQEINNMTYRMFDLVYTENVDTDMFFGDKIIQASYKYKVDEDVNYPLFKKKKDILDEVFSMSDEQMANKINKTNG